MDLFGINHKNFQSSSVLKIHNKSISGGINVPSALVPYPSSTFQNNYKLHSFTRFAYKPPHSRYHRAPLPGTFPVGLMRRCSSSSSTTTFQCPFQALCESNAMLSKDQHKRFIRLWLCALQARACVRIFRNYPFFQLGSSEEKACSLPRRCAV